MNCCLLTFQHIRVQTTLISSALAIQIELPKRIQLGVWMTPSTQELIALVEHCLQAEEPNEEQVSKKAAQNAPKKERKDIAAKQEREAKQKAAISLYLQKMPHKSIVNKVNVHLTTLRKWITKYNKGHLFKKPAPNPQTLIQQEFLDSICSFLSHPKRMCSSLREIKGYLLTKYPMKLAQLDDATVCRWVKKAGFSRKRLSAHVKERNSLEMINKRKKASVELTNHMLEGKEIIYIDEVSFNQDLVPIYGYSRIGKPALSTKRVKGKNFSVAAAVTKDKFLGFQIFKTSVAAQEFGFFLVSLLQKYPEIREDRAEYVFFMDNVLTHKAVAIKDLLAGLNVCYSAPYSPFLNPIEEVFGTWKHFYRKLIHATNESVVSCICESAKVITTNKLHKYWKQSLTYTLRSLKEETID